jgi:hypothetical protein
MPEPIEITEFGDKMEELTRLTVKMFGRKFILNPSEDLSLSPSTMGEDLQNQPARFAFYASIKDMAQMKVNQIESRVAQRRATVDAHIRDLGVLPNGTKITEDGLRRAIRTDEDLQELEGRLSDAKHELSLLSTIVAAFEHRKFMLIQLNGRANNSAFNDQTVKATVHADIRHLKAAATGVGKHPGA